MTGIVLRTRVTASWFQGGGPHHVYLPKRTVQTWMYQNQLRKNNAYTCEVDIFAEGRRIDLGALNYRSGFLSSVELLFEALKIQRGSIDVSLLARLSCDSGRPEVHIFREAPHEEEAGLPWERVPLLPFSAKSEADYMVELEACVRERSKPHEELVNKFGRFLSGIGYSPLYSKSIDLALTEPPLIVEAKAIKDENAWTSNVRAAVAQLHEYKWHLLRGASLLFLASRPVPERWRSYLVDCHAIRSAWPDGASFYVEDLNKILPLARRHMDIASASQENI